MEQTYVRPMGLGEILDASVKLYRKNFIALVIAQLPMTVFYLGYNIFTVLFTGMASTSLLDTMQPSYAEIDAALTRLILFFLIAMSAAFIQVAIVYPLSMSAMTKVVSDSILGKEPSAREGFRFYFHNWFGLGVTSVIFSLFLGIILGIGIALLFTVICFGVMLVVFVFLWVRLQAIFAVAVNEETFMVDAMRRSWDLVKGNTTKVFFALLLISLIPYGLIFSSTFFELLLGTSLGNLTLVFGTLSQGLLIPLVCAARTVIYFELRARKEGYDLEHRVTQL